MHITISAESTDSVNVRNHVVAKLAPVQSASQGVLAGVMAMAGMPVGAAAAA